MASNRITIAATVRLNLVQKRPDGSYDPEAYRTIAEDAWALMFGRESRIGRVMRNARNYAPIVYIEEMQALFRYGYTPFSVVQLYPMLQYLAEFFARYRDFALVVTYANGSTSEINYDYYDRLRWSNEEADQPQDLSLNGQTAANGPEAAAADGAAAASAPADAVAALARAPAPPGAGNPRRRGNGRKAYHPVKVVNTTEQPVEDPPAEAPPAVGSAAAAPRPAEPPSPAEGLPFLAHGAFQDILRRGMNQFPFLINHRSPRGEDNEEGEASPPPGSLDANPSPRHSSPEPAANESVPANPIDVLSSLLKLRLTVMNAQRQRMIDSNRAAQAAQPTAPQFSPEMPANFNFGGVGANVGAGAGASGEGGVAVANQVVHFSAPTIGKNNLVDPQPGGAAAATGDGDMDTEDGKGGEKEKKVNAKMQAADLMLGKFAGGRGRGRKSVITMIRNKNGKLVAVCDICGKELADPSSLYRHKKTHTGEKPHMCKICTGTFVQRYNMTQHIGTHFRHSGPNSIFVRGNFSRYMKTARHILTPIEIDYINKLAHQSESYSTEVEDNPLLLWEHNNPEWQQRFPEEYRRILNRRRRQRGGAVQAHWNAIAAENHPLEPIPEEPEEEPMEEEPQPGPSGAQQPMDEDGEPQPGPSGLHPAMVEMPQQNGPVVTFEDYQFEDEEDNDEDL